MPDNDNSQFKTKRLKFTRLDPDRMREESESFLETMRRRRSVRMFSGDPVPRETILNCIEAAAQAPSGANKQPWTFVLITDPELKHKIRESAEVEERAHYGGRAPESWLADLAPLGAS